MRPWYRVGILPLYAGYCEVFTHGYSESLPSKPLVGGPWDELLGSGCLRTLGISWWCWYTCLIDDSLVPHPRPPGRFICQRQVWRLCHFVISYLESMSLKIENKYCASLITLCEIHLLIQNRPQRSPIRSMLTTHRPTHEFYQQNSATSPMVLITLLHKK